MSRRGRGEGHIRKHPKRDLWEARVTLDDGTKKSLYGKTRTEVARKLAKVLRNHNRGMQILSDERQTVAAFLATWLEGKQHTLRSPRTWDRYEQVCRIHLAPAIGACSWPSSRRNTWSGSRRVCSRQ